MVSSQSQPRSGGLNLAGLSRAIIYLAHQIFCSTPQLSDDVFSLPSPSGRGLGEGLTRKPFLTYDLSTFKFDPRPKPSSPTLLPKGEGSKLSKYMAQTPTDFNFLIREVCQHLFKAGIASSTKHRRVSDG